MIKDSKCNPSPFSHAVGIRSWDAGWRKQIIESELHEKVYDFSINTAKRFQFNLSKAYFLDWRSQNVEEENRLTNNHFKILLFINKLKGFIIGGVHFYPSEK